MIKKFLDYLNESSNLSIKVNKNLNSKLWNNFELKNEVLEKLLEISYVWAEFAKIPEESIMDILFVGGNANFNYTDKSDIDIHLLIDKTKFPECEGLLDEYLKDKKQLWSLVHDIKIYGHPIELYAQDINETTPFDQGVYSLMNKQWIKKPQNKNIEIDDGEIITKVDQYSKEIDNLIDSNAEDKHLINLKNKFRQLRSSGLSKGGEYSNENLIFKELRNRGYIDKISKYVNSNQDKKLSL